jgi:hypothetical protein
VFAFLLLGELHDLRAPAQRLNARLSISASDPVTPGA